MFNTPHLVALLSAICFFSVPPDRGLAAEPSQANVLYGKAQGTELVLDFYAPKNSKRDVAPLIVWVHGGAWRAGSKSDMPLENLMEDGFAVASVDYRLSPVAKFPAQVHDINAAIRFMRSNASRFKIDGDRVVVMGSSAGGHLAALVGVSSEVAELSGNASEYSVSNTRVQAIVSFYGASNLQTILAQSTPHGLKVRVPALDLLLGGQPEQQPALARLASPVAHVDSNDPPIWMFHGDQDPQMPINQSHELDGAYRKLGLRSKLQVIHGGKHGGQEFFDPQLLRSLSKELQATLYPP
ncbi:MAG: alpha/beta hydrolase [Pirellula sp.]